ncbi:MAG: hypothetical protein RR645_03650 [Clostridium sp.]
MNFFCMENHFNLWTSEMGIDSDIYFKLKVDDALRAAKMIFRIDK